MAGKRKLSRGVVGRQSVAEIPLMRLELRIDGMVAVHAKHGVFTALAGVPGVISAEVELGRATVEVDDTKDLAALEAKLREATDLVGYQVEEIRRKPRTLPLL